jgi:hypothetical protein
MPGGCIPLVWLQLRRKIAQVLIRDPLIWSYTARCSLPMIQESTNKGMGNPQIGCSAELTTSKTRLTYFIGDRTEP